MKMVHDPVWKIKEKQKWVDSVNIFISNWYWFNVLTQQINMKNRVKDLTILQKHL